MRACPALGDDDNRRPADHLVPSLLHRLIGTLTTRHAVPFVVFAIGSGLALKNLIGSYGDFGVYLDVAREFQAGGVDLCRDRPNSGPWLYPHVAALPFVALLQVCGDHGARIVWSLGLGATAAWMVAVLVRTLRAHAPMPVWGWVAFAALFQRCVAQNLTHGQLSLFVGAAVVAGSAALVRGRPVAAGVWLGCATALKLTPGLFLLALPLMGQWRAAVWMAATVLVAVLLVPWPFCGTEEHLRHLHDFVDRTFGAVLAPQQTTVTQNYAGPSVRGAIDYLLQPKPTDAAGHTANLFACSDATVAIVRTSWTAALALLFGAWFWCARRLALPQRLLHQAAATAMALSLFSPLLRVYHLPAAALAFALFCRGASQSGAVSRPRLDVLWWLTALVLLFAMTLRQKKLLGEALWRGLDGGAFLHLGLVLLCVWLLRDCRREAAGTH